MSPLKLVTVLVWVFVLGCAPGVDAGGTPSPPPHTLEEAAHRLDMVLNNTRSRENYIRCFMDRGICNKDATSIKRTLSDALVTNCSNCTEIQRLGVDKFFHYLQSHQPDTWVSLTEKYNKGGGERKRHHDDDDDDDDDDEEEERGDRKSNKKGNKKKNKVDKKQTGNHTTEGGSDMHKDTPVNSSTISIIF